MKKYFIVSLLSILCTYCFAQSEKVKSLVDEGVALHDKENYEAAIKKYDEAIALDSTYITAAYEKSYTLYAMGKYEDCIALSKKIIAQFPGNELLKSVYVHYGSALDDLTKSEEAIKVYDEGLKKFPGYFLLNFNKGVTYTIMNDLDKAYEAYQLALIANPLHGSSYYRLANILKITNHIPAMLCCIMHLIIEPDTERSRKSFKTLNDLIYANVKKTGDKNVTITMDAGMLDTKKNKKELDNFRPNETLFLLSAALDKDSIMGNDAKNDIEKFDLKLQLLISSISEHTGKGFFSERYIGFFKELKAKNFTSIVSRLVYSNTNDDRNAIWLKVHAEKVDEFYDWVKAYKWPEK